MKRVWILAIFLLAPLPAAGQVVISEIMFDLETGSDSGREWIEVFNTSADTALLTDWKLFENASNHAIGAHTGGEVLPSGSYAVIADNPAKFLEDHASYAGLLFDSAFSLSNTGETLILRCCGSDLVDKDTVTYTSESGGNGDGKTLQRTAALAAFSAAAPSPGSGSLLVESGTETETETDEPPLQTATTTGATVEKKTESSYVPPPVPVLFVDGGEDRAVIVGADTEFRARAYNRKQEVLDHVRFNWNFGDGAVAEGESVLHHYEYPGKYVVYLAVALDKAAYGDRIVVDAEPARLSFLVYPDSSVAITNRSGRELDLSGWSVRSFGGTFTLSEHSLVLPGETLRIPQKLHMLTVGPGTELLYPNGMRASGITQNPTSTPPAAPQITTVVRTAAKSQAAKKEGSVTSAPAQQQRDMPVSFSIAEAQTASAENVRALPAFTWWAAALMIGIFGAGALYMIRGAQGNEWEIIEESGEAV